MIHACIIMLDRALFLKVKSKNRKSLRQDFASENKLKIAVFDLILAFFELLKRRVENSCSLQSEMRFHPQSKQ